MTLNHKPYTINHKPGTRNQKPEPNQMILVLIFNRGQQRSLIQRVNNESETSRQRSARREANSRNPRPKGYA